MGDDVDKERAEGHVEDLEALDWQLPRTLVVEPHDLNLRLTTGAA